MLRALNICYQHSKAIAMRYDRSKIMQDAWAIARRFAGNSETWGQRLARALKSVWWSVKEAARIARAVAAKAAAKPALAVAALRPVRPAHVIARDILCLECKDRLVWQDFQRLDALRIELTEANRREPIAA